MMAATASQPPYAVTTTVLLLRIGMNSILKNGPLFAVIAHGLVGISLVWDKVLLKRPGTKNLFSYVFLAWQFERFRRGAGALRVQPPSLGLMSIAFLAGLVHLLAIFSYYEALKRGKASETLAIMGGFSPVATALIALALLSRQMTGEQLIGFAMMTAGGFIMFFSEKLPLKKLLVLVALASGLFGMVNVLEKVVYKHTNFVTGYVWFTIGTFAGAMALLIRRSWRSQIFEESGQDKPSNRFWYFVNRFISGVGSFLIFYAISLTHPAVVSAIAGVRYAVIFVGALLLTKVKPRWLKEDFRGWQLATKAVATGLVIAGVVLVGMSGRGQGSAGTSASNAADSQSQRERYFAFGDTGHRHRAALIRTIPWGILKTRYRQMDEAPAYAEFSDQELRQMEAEFGRPLSRELALWFTRNRTNREAIERMLCAADSGEIDHIGALAHQQEAFEIATPQKKSVLSYKMCA
ncbi:MAG TPA: EamA family transporter [Candidatus Acidoferrales bacterium]|nr:EamA family transporter [Candidatus Acidoferrales bacterium]